MKTFIILLGSFMLSQAGYASDISLDKKAIRAFVVYQNAGQDQQLVNQVRNLKKEGLILREAPRATLIEGGCGFAGCSYRLLVTTAYHSEGANPQTKSINAVVQVSTYENSVVEKILSQKEIQWLLH